MLKLIILFITITLVIISYYYYRFYQYWKRKNVPCLQSEFSKSSEHLGIKFQSVYNILKKNRWKYGGVYTQFSPVFVVGDLDFVKNVMSKDFGYFPHRGLYHNEEKDPLSAHIFNLSGTKWRRMRTKLNQIFTPLKLKLIFPILLHCEENLQKEILKAYEHNEPLDVKLFFDKFISEVIELSSFGLDCKKFNLDLNNFVRRIFNRSLSRRLKGFIVENFPTLGKVFNISLISREASDFFMTMVTNIIRVKEFNGGSNKSYDFLQILLDLKKEDGVSFTVEEIAAQCFIFFIAGMSTSPTAMTFALYELAKNQDIQENVRDEIESVLKKYHGEICYDSVKEMEYLDLVLKESLRKYPPAAYLNRKCEEAYKIPDDSGVVIEKGTTVVIPVLGIHCDEDYYPDPEKFDPERFRENSERLKKGYSYIPFGEGPRICIGMRFGLMQSKIGLMSVLRNYKFTVSRQTREPLKIKPKPLVMTADGGIWLDVQKI